MAQPRRICLPDVTYHTFSRCHNRDNLMTLDRMKDLLLEVINMAMEKYIFQLSTYAIMDNHFHFVIKTVKNEADISHIMQFIKAQYARRYNKITGRTGAFWNERFGDTIIEMSDDPEGYFMWLKNYINHNPVRAGIVCDPRKYKYSSIHAYLDENYLSPVKITIHEYYLKLGSTFQERVKKFKQYEDAYNKRLSLSFL
ncbi:MAG TPA: transposase [Spirochaetota bacterium]|nr:transposase [Spirochaetota bacterium]HPI90406.1 transposase [Spirochaetota bacterium]HPR48511.1 transposase [Spirochaetota bacterium]